MEEAAAERWAKGSFVFVPFKLGAADDGLFWDRNEGCLATPDENGAGALENAEKTLSRSCSSSCSFE